ncbi:TTC28 [Branchiostoma lanceolatum]|uniref:TTC28 protein n=1 Tax=Branchiostoma lanceolatum TaxID=7740 RepID=A0A8K0EWW1_BRALA|nr:TTC28 [Branchiostoma lanceolatum]
MSEINMTSLADKLQDLDLCLKSQDNKEHCYGRALREAILCLDLSMEVEVLKSLGDLHLQKGKLSKDSAEFDKAAGLYAAALLRCKDPDMGQTLEHRIGYMEKLSRQLQQGYIPHFRWLSPDYWGTADSNLLRVAETCYKVDRNNKNSQHSVEETYTESLVTAIENGDMFFEVEILKSLGDFFLEQGKTNYDISQFSKSTAMYKKALTTCEDPETKQSLHHRIRYAEKIREAVRRKSTTMKQIGRRPSMSPLSQYKDHLKKGESSLTRGNLDSAEKHFAAALKTVHIPDPTAQQYQREVEPLCKLGDVYSKRGQQTGDGGDFVKAVALYNAAKARSEDQLLNDDITTDIKEVGKSFLTCILDIHCNVSEENTENHKKQLKEMRDQIKLEMETIDQQLDPYVYDEGDPCVKGIEAKRAQAVRHLFENIAQQRKEFISLLVEECIRVMGPPPCKYALIGLGSQATGLVTPYSDLEFAILVEEESKPCLVYFRNLTHYLHLKVVNLGETILPALGIKSLNDFYSEDPLDNWYYDSVTPRGFAFDGSMPKASKTPLGRQGTMDKPLSELICTPNNMVKILQNDVTLYLKEGYHLATILRNPCLLAGDQDLIDTYMVITEKTLRANGGKMAQQLAQETQRENIQNYIYSNEETITAKLINVKKDIYRFPSLAVDCLALSSDIKPTTIWMMIEEMENKQVISPNNAHHLTVLTSISAELRLRTYIANGGQKENVSALASMERILNQPESSIQIDEELLLTNALKPVFHLPAEKQLFRYYHTAVSLKSYFSKWSGKTPDLQPFSDFYDTSPKVQGHMCNSLCKYRLAISYYHEALETADGTNTEDNMLLLSKIGDASLKVGDYQKAISYYEQELKMHGQIHGNSIHIAYRGIILNNIGLAWCRMGDLHKAISYHEQALKMDRSIYEQIRAHADIVIATSLNNLGGAWSSLGNCRKAISYYEQALQVNRRLYGETTPHPTIAILLNNLGGVCRDLGEHRRAVSYHEQALQMYRSIYGQQTAHPDIAIGLNNLGSACDNLGEYRKAISYHEQALQVFRWIYGKTHPYIATSLNNLGNTWGNLGEHGKKVRYLEQALQMRKSIEGLQTASPDIALLLNNLGIAWHHLSDHRKAISYYEQALQVNRRIYGETSAHPHIANSLGNLGSVWSSLGEHGKAVSYHEQALKMRRSIYGPQTPHQSIAKSLSSLGLVSHREGDYTKAISYYEQALQMFRGIYGPQTMHPDITISLSNLGGAWCALGDYRKTLSYYEQALQMKESIYGQGTPHPDIALLLNNIGTLFVEYLGDSAIAISYFDRALRIMRGIYGASAAHINIAMMLNNLGGAWKGLGSYRRAISCYEQALQMLRSIYAPQTAHLEIAKALNNLGVAWYNEGDYRKAISYYEQALQMERSIYGQQAVHPGISRLLNNLGTAWNTLGEHRRAISYHEQALQMEMNIYGQRTAHPDIITLLGSLGEAWRCQGDYRKAIVHHEQALEMSRSVYGQTKAHPMIAGLLNKVGLAWSCLDEHRRAVSYYGQALQMLMSIHGPQTAHPHIATLLNNIGMIFQQHLGDSKQAMSYFNRALQMIKSICGQSHHLITTLLNNMGEAWADLGDYRKAISYHEQALQTRRRLYGPQEAHPNIALSMYNLGVVLVKFGDSKKATRTLRQALAMANQIHHQNHPMVKAIERHLAKISATSIDER